MGFKNPTVLVGWRINGRIIGICKGNDCIKRQRYVRDASNQKRILAIIKQLVQRIEQSLNIGTWSREGNLVAPSVARTDPYENIEVILI